jgi:CelD/BcsL family acetyltransferase involved in cellulose biosynthesis
LNVAEIDPIRDSRWLAFVEATPGASIFHHPSWLSVIEDTYGYKSVCLGAIDAQSLVGILPLIEVRSWLTGRRAVCLPFSDSCGALVRDDEASQTLLRFCRKLQIERRWRYVEIRDCVASEGFGAAARYKSNRLALGPDPDAVCKNFNQQSRRKLRKAENAGVRVERRTDAEALRAFIDLNALTRRKHGVPPQPDKLFRNIERKLLSAGLGFIGVAVLANRIVSADVFLHWKNTVVYKYGASDERALSVGANYAVMSDAIRWACERKFTEFDLGRSDLTNEGLLQFKRGWGSLESDLVYTRLGVDGDRRVNETPGMLERMKPIVARVPLPVLKIVGRMLYGHIG